MGSILSLVFRELVVHAPSFVAWRWRVSQGLGGGTETGGSLDRGGGAPHSCWECRPVAPLLYHLLGEGDEEALAAFWETDTA